MQRSIRHLCLAIALTNATAMTSLAIAPTPTHAAATPSSSVIVITPALNLRAGPRLSAPILRRLARGAVLRVLFYHISWVAVTTPDALVGYVYRYDVRPIAPVAATTAIAVTPSTPRAVFQPPYLTVAVAAAALRDNPAIVAPTLLVLPRHTTLALLGVDRTGTWARVVTRAGRVGWIARFMTVSI